jgi:CHAT domain-containing protein
VAALLADLLPQPHTNAALGLAQPVLDMLDAGAACVQAARYVQEVVNATRQQHGLPAALSGPEIEALAATTGSTLLLVHPLPDRTLLAVTHGPGRTALRWSAVGRDALATLVAQCWAALDSHQAPRAAGEAGTMSADAEVLDAALRDLYQGLIAPVADQLAPARPLCMVPYHALTWLPWHMLTDEAGKYLFERLPLTVMPSVALWAALHADPAETGLAQSAYIVAAPATEPTWNLARLPETVAEARDIATLLTAHGIADAAVRVRTDTDATVPSYASEAAQADIVHLGCHGELGPVAEVSRLFLTPVEGSDGVLLANDMPAVHLGRGLVFLAACKRTEGWPTVDGVMGLSAAFWRAGARCVVLSLWQANAQARQLLLHHFYEALLDPLRPVSIAVALQTAMLATRTALLAGGIRAPDGTVISAHPVHWAPFIVLGDPMGYGSPGPDDSTQTLSSYGA